MASIVKRKNRYSVVYTVRDEKAILVKSGKPTMRLCGKKAQGTGRI